MSNYNFKKFKRNIFILEYNDNINNIYFKRVIKIPIVLKNTVLKEYQIYNQINKTEYSQLFTKIIDFYSFKNVLLNQPLLLTIKYNDQDIIIKFNLYNLIENNILDFEIFKKYLIYDYDKTCDMKYHIINNLSFLIQEYYEKSVSLFDYYNFSSRTIFDKILVIKNCLKNLSIIHNKLNLIHGDFKSNNILYNEDTYKPIFIDLEFSYINDLNNEYINVKDIYEINLYLKLKENRKVNFNFLKLFDVYIFTISFLIHYTLRFNKFVLQQLTNELLHYNEFNFNLFVTLFYLILIYCENNNLEMYNINDIKFHNCCRYKSIYKVIYEQIFIINNNKLKESKEWIINIFENI